MKVKVLNRFFHVYAINVTMIIYVGFFGHTLLCFHHKCTMDFRTLCYFMIFYVISLYFELTKVFVVCVNRLCPILRSHLFFFTGQFCWEDLGPTSSFLLFNFMENIKSRLFSLTSWLCQKYPLLLSLPDFINNFLGPLYDLHYNMHTFTIHALIINTHAFAIH